MGIKWIYFFCAFLLIVLMTLVDSGNFRNFLAFLKIIIPIAYATLLYNNKENKVCFWNFIFVSMACSFIFIPVKNDEVLLPLSAISIIVFITNGILLWRKEWKEKKKSN